MAEGTKLGEYSSDLRFNTAVSVDLHQEAEQLSGTRIGEMSEFEKSLYTQEELATKEKEAQKARQVREAARRELEEAKASGKDIRKAPHAEADLFADEFESFLDYKEGDVVKGVVRGVAKGGLLVDFGYKADGFVPSNEISSHSDMTLETVQPGQEIDVYIERLETKEGCSILSMKRAEYEVAWNQIMTIAKTKEMIDVRVVSRVEGGFVAEFHGIRGFIPASHIIIESPEDAERLVGQDLTVVVLQADRKRRKVVFSNKLARQRSSRGDARKVLESIQVGETRKGVVSSIKDFGAFVDIGGVEGLVHISELSWARVNHPSEVVKVGDEVNTFVLGVDKETRKISLGMKQLQPDPWVTVNEKYHVGQIVTGTISRIVNFGAFMQLEKDLEGLIHISELSNERVGSVEDVVSVGDTVSARIIKLVPDEQRIGLSLKALQSSEHTHAEADITQEAA